MGKLCGPHYRHLWKHAIYTLGRPGVAPPWSRAVVLPRDLDTYRWRMRPFANAALRRSRRASQNQARLRSCFYSNKWANAKGPTTQRQYRHRKLRQGLYNRRTFEPVQSADGEEWCDADAYQPQEYKVPDENLMPTWYARMYVMPFDEVAHAAFFQILWRGGVLEAFRRLRSPNGQPS